MVQTNQVYIELPKKLDRYWLENNKIEIDKTNTKTIFDFSNTILIDSAGASFIYMCNQQCKSYGTSLVIKNISTSLLDTLEKWTGKMSDTKASSFPKPPFLIGIGNGVIAAYNESITAISVLVEMIYWGTIGCFYRRDFRRGILGEQMYILGYSALGIVVLLSFLIGVVLAIQTAIQLRQFGADIFLAPLIGVSMVREFGPLLTAIILAGRTGSATTAEIATMGVQEEIDALKVMSINPVQFVVVPKFWAITLTMPLLSICSVAAGIFGGYLVAVFYLGISSNLYWGELAKAIWLKDFLAGFIKSVVFSWLIIWIGAYYGFKVRGGAEEVGKETTASVVSGLFIIILADAIFSFII